MAAVRKTHFMGLPTTGAMGTEPAMSVTGIIGIISIVVGIVVQLTGWTVPPDVQDFFDQWGPTLVGLGLALYALISGWFVRQRVVSPATAVDRGAA